MFNRYLLSSFKYQILFGGLNKIMPQYFFWERNQHRAVHIGNFQCSKYYILSAVVSSWYSDHGGHGKSWQVSWNSKIKLFCGFPIFLFIFIYFSWICMALWKYMISCLPLFPEWSLLKNVKWSFNILMENIWKHHQASQVRNAIK